MGKLVIPFLEHVVARCRVFLRFVVCFCPGILVRRHNQSRITGGGLEFPEVQGKECNGSHYSHSSRAMPNSVNEGGCAALFVCLLRILCLHAYFRSAFNIKPYYKSFLCPDNAERAEKIADAIRPRTDILNVTKNISMYKFEVASQQVMFKWCRFYHRIKLF